MNAMIKKVVCDAEKRQHHVAQKLDEMIRDGSEINYATVAQRCGVSRQYLYRHPEFCKIINDLRISGMTKQDLQQEVIRLRFQIQELTKKQTDKYEECH